MHRDLQTLRKMHTTKKLGKDCQKKMYYSVTLYFRFPKLFEVLTSSRIQARVRVCMHTQALRLDVLA